MSSEEPSLLTEEVSMTIVETNMDVISSGIEPALNTSPSSGEENTSCCSMETRDSLLSLFRNRKWRIYWLTIIQCEYSRLFLNARWAGRRNWDGYSIWVLSSWWRWPMRKTARIRKSARLGQEVWCLIESFCYSLSGKSESKSIKLPSSGRSAVRVGHTTILPTRGRETGWNLSQYWHWTPNSIPTLDGIHSILHGFRSISDLFRGKSVLTRRAVLSKPNRQWTTDDVGCH